MNKNKIIIFVLTATLIIISTGCYYDNSEFLYPSRTQCDSTAVVSYQKDIIPTLNNHCLSCHGATYAKDGKDIRLESYNDVVSYYDRIVGAINHYPGKSSMPKSAPKLNPCVIKQFESWQSNGFPNN